MRPARITPMTAVRIIPVSEKSEASAVNAEEVAYIESVNYEQ